MPTSHDTRIGKRGSRTAPRPGLTGKDSKARRRERIARPDTHEERKARVAATLALTDLDDNERAAERGRMMPKPAAAKNVPVFSGDLTSARARFKDLCSVFLRLASAEHLNGHSYQLATYLSVHYGLTDLFDGIEKEIREDRRTAELRRPAGSRSRGHTRGIIPLSTAQGKE